MNKATKILFQIEAAALVGLTLLAAPAFGQQGMQSAATRNANQKKAALASGSTTGTPATTNGTATSGGVNTGSLYSKVPSLSNLYAGPAPAQPVATPSSSAPANGPAAPNSQTELLPATSDLFQWNPTTGGGGGWGFGWGGPGLAYVAIGGRGPWGGFVGKGFLAPLPPFIINSQLGYDGRGGGKAPARPAGGTPRVAAPSLKAGSGKTK